MAMQPGALIQGRGGRIVGADLTDMQRAFVRAYVRNGGNAKAAADEAGYSQSHARAWELTTNPRVMDAIRVEQSRVITGELATLAVGVVRDILNDKELSPKVRLDAAKTVLDRAGHIAPKAEAPQDPASVRDLNQMDRDQLEAFIERAQRAIADQAKPVIDGQASHDESANGAPSDSQAIDIVDESPV